MAQLDDTFGTSASHSSFSFSRVFQRTFTLLASRLSVYAGFVMTLMVALLLVDLSLSQITFPDRESMVWTIFILKIIMLSLIYSSMQYAIIVFSHDLHKEQYGHIFQYLYMPLGRILNVFIVFIPLDIFFYGIYYQSHFLFFNVYFSLLSVLGIILVLVFSAAPPICAIERKSTIEPFRDSYRISKGFYFNIFILLFVFGLLFTISENSIRFILQNFASYLKYYWPSLEKINFVITDQVNTFGVYVTLVVRSALWTSIYIELTNSKGDVETNKLSAAFD